MPRITLLIGLFVVLVWAVHVLYSYTAAFAGRRMKGKIFYMILNRTSAVLFWLLCSRRFLEYRRPLAATIAVLFGHLRARNVQGKGPCRPWGWAWQQGARDGARRCCR